MGSLSPGGVIIALEACTGGILGHMTYEGEGGDGGISVPKRHHLLHYHGGTVRVLFVVSAFLLIVAKSTGADIPLTTFGTVVAAVVLVVAAGITNPALSWIHWTNFIIAAYGTVLFGTTAVERYRAGVSAFDYSFVYIEALALIFLLTLYLTTRTIRGMRMKLLDF